MAKMAYLNLRLRLFFGVGGIIDTCAGRGRIFLLASLAFRVGGLTALVCGGHCIFLCVGEEISWEWNGMETKLTLVIVD
jgi:hypothetical protein